MSNFLFNKKDTAKIMGVSVQALSQWDIQAVESSGREIFYDLPAVVQWKISKVTERAASGTLEEERIRLTKAQADKTELEVSVLECTLVSAEEVERNIGDMIGAFRAKTLSIPTKAAPEIVKIRSIPAAESFLRGLIFEALAELSNYEPEPPTVDLPSGKKSRAAA